MQRGQQIYKTTRKDKPTTEDGKIFAEIENEQETQLQTVRLDIKDMGMKFDIGKCVMLKIKKREGEKIEG